MQSTRSLQLLLQETLRLQMLQLRVAVRAAPALRQLQQPRQGLVVWVLAAQLLLLALGLVGVVLLLLVCIRV